ncbi:tetratricopeptide repeat protein [Mucilaginibacter segetis]|uniref:Tetratricopeptide repeat protein n=1 Tax=Mucilaginibacter segetis TaxID=2793071 RepID=A0A934UNN0_9SPHI|nr:tetratricopeptide repeat protein [Mucilaginibacter segetis]MBK0380260.1 tetratricopeptide repeat protein [Mucilaginibacter segetis]
MRKKQIVVSVIVIAVMGYLYSLPVKGLVKPPEAAGTNEAASAEKPAANITQATVSTSAKKLIDPSIAQKIDGLESKLGGSNEAEKADLQRTLATEWDNVGQPAPAAFYYLALAKQNNTMADWLNAGNRFNEAYKVTQDASEQSAFTANAVEAFENAAKLQPDNLEAKTGLGTAYVNGGATPMQGIALLLEVVKKDPNNWNANLNLGLFSMKSGQFEKAVQRFKTLISQKEAVEPYFYLAESYKQLGQKKEAIAAYERCKQLMGDPVAGQRIDEYIKELKK